ncbi:hypothetical protein [Roseococcus sp. YIM B11640]|uniref:hypothetical protein n=1 Tax=Roseococcus sp. YIM B11640 TaxID=3133973 RepID=UPI003C7B9AD6
MRFPLAGLVLPLLALAACQGPYSGGRPDVVGSFSGDYSWGDVVGTGIGGDGGYVTDVSRSREEDAYSREYGRRLR